MDETPIIVRLADVTGESLPMANVLLSLRFYVEGRYRYDFRLGRTDPDGLSRTGLREIHNQLEVNRHDFIMDYNTPLSDCDDVVGIYAPTPEENARMQVSRLKWFPELGAIPNTANHLVHCGEQKFTFRPLGPNEFTLVCRRVSE